MNSKIAALLKQMQRSGISAAVHPGSDLDDLTLDCDDWTEELAELFEMHPRKLHAQIVRIDDMSVEIHSVHDDINVTATVRDGNARHRVFVSPFGAMAESPAGCSCPQSRGEDPCLHSLALIDELLNQLGKPESMLRRRITAGRFDPGDPRPFEATSTDPSDVARRVNEIARTIAPESLGDEAWLPPIATKPDQRIQWAFSFDGHGFTVGAMLQQRKKRGIGFTKGRKLSLERLVSDHDLPLSDADARARDCIGPVRSYSYDRRGGYAIDVVAAADQLVGQENVSLNGEPVRIDRRGLELSLCQLDADAWGFRIVDREDPSRVTPILGSGNRLVRLDDEKHLIEIIRCQESTVDSIHELLRFAPFGTEAVRGVVDQIEPLREAIGVRLPESVGGDLIGGETISQPPEMVVLLRSRPDGKLDIAIRVRGGGRLLRPGQSPLILADTVNGKPIQRVRDDAAEFAAATRLLDDLHLPYADFSHADTVLTIDDFETALRLIERLQSGDVDAEILWDRSSEKPVKVLGGLGSQNVRVEITSKRNWFGVGGTCHFGDKEMPLAELLKGLPRGDAEVGDFVRLGDGGWARIEKKLQRRLKKLRDATHVDRRSLQFDATAAPAIRDLVDDDVEVKTSKAWEKCLRRLADAEQLDPQLPAGLDATLREYQVEGYRWLRRLAAWGVGGVLADDMGLGKTLQTLAVLLDRSADGPALVIAPTSVGFNWAREAARFAPDLDVHLYRETERADFLPRVGPRALVICSYGLAMRDAKALAGVQWNTLVLDEAQAIKNSRSKTSKAIATIPADWTVALTGTPVENHLGELWSLFHVVSPGVFGGWDAFRNRFASPIEKDNDEDARVALAERIQPFVLRRTKDEVLRDLPPRTEMNLVVDLSPEQRARYELVRREAIGELDELSAISDIQDQRFKILALMTRLRQIACHVGMIDEDWKGSSAKLDQLCETLISLREEGHRALVFSQFTKHLALIRLELESRGFTMEYLDGSTPANSRQEAVDRFQTGTADVFLISLKAGGTGLNLTAADYVIHMDPWWNPAVEDQATDRAHRIGQNKPVMVYRIVARATIEEEILALHDAKRDLVAGVMAGTQAAAKLSSEDLVRMLRADAQGEPR